MRVLIVWILWVVSASADPLKLNDYAAIAGGQSSARVGDVAISLGADGYDAVDQSGHGAVGCFVSRLALLEATQLMCGLPVTEAEATVQDAYRRVALVFYGRHVQPPTTLEAVHARYAALVARQRPQCTDEAGFAALKDHFFGPKGRIDFEDLLSAPRLPVSHPCP